MINRINNRNSKGHMQPTTASLHRCVPGVRGGLDRTSGGVAVGCYSACCLATVGWVWLLAVLWHCCE